ncbi:MAG: DUF3332 family protein [Spirochaetales bacterium]|nr:DUF3332 family protein [Leptospiraceae bacterium]MCP5483699.1 DUF3332 family protein [Spirochaetales bacterium]
MKRMIAASLIAVTGYIGLAQCHGGFVLTRKFDGFVSSIGNKWIRWIVFLVAAILQLYSLTILADVVVLNSIEFWTGSNPVAFNYDANGQFRRQVTEDGVTAVFTYSRYGEQLRIDVLANDGRKARNIVLLREQPGRFYTELNGNLVPVDVNEYQNENARLFEIEAAGRTLYQSEVSEAGYEDLVGRVGRHARVHGL